MEALDPTLYYKEHAADEQTYVPILAAHEVRAGESYWNGLFHEVVKQDGFVARSYTHDRVYFMSNEEVARRMDIVASDKTPQDRQAIAEEDLKNFEPVAQGEEMTVTGVLGPEKRIAAQDGMVITEGDRRHYKTNLEVSSQFNYTGKKRETRRHMLITQRGIPAMTGIILKENVTFKMYGRRVFAYAGDLLYTNRYTNKLDIRRVAQPNLELRCISQTPAEKQALLKGKRPKFVLK